MRKLFLVISAIVLAISLRAQTDLWGATTYGGNQYGTIYSFATGSSTMSSQYNLTGPHMGTSPRRKLILASNGKMYGMTSGGGTSVDGTSFGNGIIFEYDPITGGYSKKYDFVKANGSNLSSHLIEVSSGIFYGMAAEGGTNDLGTIFEYNLNTNTCTKKIDFDGIATGSRPSGSLLKASNGKLYGLAYSGGTQGTGTLFEFDIATNSFQKKIDFSGNTGAVNNQWYPAGDLIEVGNSKLYGLSSGGGSYGFGTIFVYDINLGTCTTVFNFDGALHGKFPFGSLMKASNGKLYGTTKEGGSSNQGVIFEYDLSSNTCTNKFDFHTNNGSPGTNPQDGLVEAPDGNLYGMTHSGGSIDGYGALYKFNPVSGAYTKMLNFNLTDGILPTGSLINGPGSKLYGMVSSGGMSNSGVLFEYDPAANVYTKKFDFSDATGGAHPQGGLMQASNGKFYGTTYGIHTYKNYGGTLYEFDPLNQTYVKKIDFTGNGGINPIGSLIEALPGKLYGVASQSGGSGSTSGSGSIFEYDLSSGILTEKFSFLVSAQAGLGPIGPLFKASNGKLYGTTQFGGINNEGTLFEYDLYTSTVTTLTNFIAFKGRPQSSPVEGLDGKLYGQTIDNIYRYDPITMTYTLLTSLGSTTGTPSGQLTLAPNGKLYGMTTNGGINGRGSILSCNPLTSSYSKVADFNNIGAYPHGAMTLAPDGKLYGACGVGSDNNGMIFKFDPSTNSLSKVFDFNGLNGRFPLYTQLFGPCQASAIRIIGPDQLCSGSGQSVFYNVPLATGSTFTWTAPPGVSISPNNHSNNISLNLSSLSQGVYTLSVSTTNACSITLSSALTLTVNPASSLPAISIVGAGTVCQGSSVTFTATGVNTYTWNGGVTNAVFNAIPVSSTTYSVMGTDLNTCIVTETVAVTVNSNCQDVWPGDANSDGTVDNIDVLEVGLHFNQTGPARTLISNTWHSYFANNWTNATSNGKNLSHSDCNGDGIINSGDTLAIYSNYGLIHAFKQAQETPTNPQLRIIPDQLFVNKGTWGTASVFLGEASSPVSNINGLAFTLNFDQSLLDVNSFYIEYPLSFLNTGNQNLKFQKCDSANGRLYTATTHTNNTNISGYGKIAIVHYKIKSTLATDELFCIGITQTQQSNAAGVLTPLSAGTAIVAAIGASVGMDELSNGNIVGMYPNPANSTVTIQSNTKLEKVELLSITGQIMLSEKGSGTHYQLDLANIANGVYMVHIYSADQKVTRKKLVVQR